MLEQLRDLDARRMLAVAQFAEEEHQLVKQIRELRSYSQTGWDVIAEALGISRQAVMKRHAERLEAESTKPSWSNPHRRRYDAGTRRR